MNKRLADLETGLQQPALDDSQGGEKTAGSIIHIAYTRIYQRFRLERNRRGRPQTLRLQKPIAVEEAAVVIANWARGAADTDKVVEEAWRERWLKEREGRAVLRPADNFNHQQQTLFQDKTLKRHEGLTKAESFRC